MISVRDLCFGYDATVLSAVSFDVAAGETVALLGANGAGKTTLLRLVAGLAEPDAGTVRVGADDDGTVGFAPENPAAGLFAETVREEVAFFPRNRGLDVDRRVERAMCEMAVEDLRDRDPFSLSAGEQRRVSIAAVLAGDPDVVVLDEPTAGLGRDDERRLASRLSDLDATVVFSTHDADFAFAVADRAGVLVDGTLRRVDDARTVLSDRSLLEDGGIRPPGIVVWSRRRGLDRVPEDLEGAVAVARGER